MAREIETVYDTTSKDRVRYVRHRLNVGSWTDVTSTGCRHVKYDTAMDKLDRLRCLSRAPISWCAAAEPWESKFLESFDYDSSGNRTIRGSGAFNTADDDAYTYVSGPPDRDRARHAGVERGVGLRPGHGELLRGRELAGGAVDQDVRAVGRQQRAPARLQL